MNNIGLGKLACEFRKQLKMPFGTLIICTDREENDHLGTGIIQRFPLDFVIEDGNGHPIPLHCVAPAMGYGHVLANARGTLGLTLMEGLEELIHRIYISGIMQSLSQILEDLFLGIGLEPGDHCPCVDRLTE